MLRVQTLPSPFGDYLDHGIDDPFVMVMIRGNGGWEAPCARPCLPHQTYLEKIEPLYDQSFEIAVVGMQSGKWVTVWALDGEATFPPAAEIQLVASPLREALEYVGQRTDGDPLTLAERCALWMRESKSLIDNPQEVKTIRDEDGEIVKVMQGTKVIAATTYAGGKPPFADAEMVENARRYEYLRNVPLNPYAVLPVGEALDADIDAALSLQEASQAAQPRRSTGVHADVILEYLDASACYNAADKSNREGERARLQEARIVLDNAIVQAHQPAAWIDPKWSLHDRVEFALRDAGFELDEASRIATLAAQQESDHG